MTDILAQADQLEHEKKFQEAHTLLTDAYIKDDKNLEVLWRLAKTHYQLYETTPKEEVEKKKEHLETGLGMALRAIDINPNHFGGHKWAAICYAPMGAYLTGKDQVQTAHKIKEHAQKAYELNPNDAANLYTLGMWAQDIANIGFMTRSLAAVFVGSLPKSTNEEALDWLTKSAQVDPNFTRALIAAGDVCVKLGKKKDAKEWYNKAVAAPVINEVDQELNDEAMKKAKSV